MQHTQVSTQQDSQAQRVISRCPREPMAETASGKHSLARKLGPQPTSVLSLVGHNFPRSHSPEVASPSPPALLCVQAPQEGPQLTSVPILPSQSLLRQAPTGTPVLRTLEPRLTRTQYVTSKTSSQPWESLHFLSHPIDGSFCHSTGLFTDPKMPTGPAQASLLPLASLWAFLAAPPWPHPPVAYVPSTLHFILNTGSSRL